MGHWYVSPLLGSCTRSLLMSESKKIQRATCHEGLFFGNRSTMVWGFPRMFLADASCVFCLLSSLEGEDDFFETIHIPVLIILWCIWQSQKQQLAVKFRSLKSLISCFFWCARVGANQKNATLQKKRLPALPLQTPWNLRALASYR